MTDALEFNEEPAPAPDFEAEAARHQQETLRIIMAKGRLTETDARAALGLPPLRENANEEK